MQGNAEDGGQAELCELARRAAGGDDEATARLLRRIGPVVLRCARGVLGAQHPAVEDAAQESLVALLAALPGFRGDASVQRYASRITARIAIKLGRRWRKERGVSLDEAPALQEASAEPASMQGRRAALLRELLADLPDAQAEALVMKVVLGYALEEIAVEANVSANTVRSRIRLAKEALRRRIERAPRLGELRRKSQ